MQMPEEEETSQVLSRKRRREEEQQQHSDVNETGMSEQHSDVISFFLNILKSFSAFLINIQRCRHLPLIKPQT